VRKVLITGGLGYLGGRIAQFLGLQGQAEVILGSRQPCLPPAWLPAARMVETRWDSDSALEAICAEVDAVVHCAGMNAQACAADPVAALQINAVATARLVRAAARMRVKRLIYMSTAHVYGSPLTGVLTENTCPVALHPYATSHRAGEDAVLSAFQRREIDGIVIRLSNGYGAPMHKEVDCWTLLVNDLCRQAVSTRRMLVHSSGLARRDFVPLQAVCSAVAHLLHVPAQDLGSGLFNVGGDWSPTVWEMACLVQERCAGSLGFRPELSRAAPQAGETTAPLDYRLDNLLRSGFQPPADKLAEIDQLLAFCQDSFA